MQHCIPQFGRVFHSTSCPPCYACAGGLDAVATLEWDFGDGGHSYQAAPTHVYSEPGRRFSGFAIVVDSQGQAVTKTFTVDTTFPAATLANLSALTASLGLVPVAQLALQQPCVHAQQGDACLPSLLVAANMTAGMLTAESMLKTRKFQAP